MRWDITTSFLRVSLDCNHFLDHVAYSYLPREKTGWTDRIEQRGSWPNEGKRALIQKLSSSLGLLFWGLLSSSLSAASSDFEGPLGNSPACQPSLISSLCFWPCRTQHHQAWGKYQLLLFSLPLPACSTFTANVERNPTKQGRSTESHDRQNMDLNKAYEKE